MASSSSHSPSNSVAYSTNPITSQTPSSFPSASLPTSWDVFLSFCGKDTRYNFTSHLYDKLVSYGIRTFMDDPELHIGEVITNSLVQAIHESKIYIIVFSQNYASSPWCLDELVQIYNCYEKMNRLVIGVYCNIDPSVVRHQKESFAKAFEDHRDRYAVEKVNDWRRTLKFVAGFSGKHVSAKRSEADIINEIVERVVLEINPKTLDVAKYPVGLDARVKDITTLLSTQTEGVIKFGIYGMGGVGKTTLAKALFNQLLLGSFHGNCFLANVRDVSGRPNGIESLQQQLIDDVLRRKTIFKVNNVDEGSNFMGDRIHLKKVLVVIDDVDDHKQFESLVRPFAPGSVVIITTRDEELLDTIEVESRYRYKVSELDDADSLTLFTQHAFGTAKPNDSLIALFEDILHHAGGLPLALEVFGSYLYKRPEVGWRSFIEKLQRTPNNTIQQRLIISLDALESDDPMLKKLFLDIACFFIGCDKEWVVKRIESYYPYADHNINILRKKCLLTINNYDELGMHDLLRDMGREIGRNTYPDEPGKHSRLYLSEDICNVLKKYEGTKAIEGIYLNKFDRKKDALEGEPLFVETFNKMSKLRFLYLESSVSITGNFEHAFEDLRWLYWKYCPLEHLPSNFFPQKLGILELTYSKMRTMWEPRMVAQVFEKLKILNFSYSRDLTTTPDFNKLPCLETLDLEGCKSLVEIHISIGSLVKLFSLNLAGCVNLRSLPDSICNLRALEKFNIGGCRCLEALPLKMGDMKSLTELEAYGLNLSKLPNSIGDLSKLVKLILYFNKRLETLPDSICNLRALEVLDINDCYKLKALPIEIGNVKSLKELNVKCLNVLNIPDSIGHLSKVVELNLSYNKNLKTIPDTICNMRSLEILDISGCEKLEILPYQLWKITWLRELHVSYATMFKKLPDIESSHIAALSLNVLDLSESGVTALPSGTSQLLKLQVLNVGGCRQLLSITELPPNLEKLRAYGCFSLTIIQNLSSLKWLEILDLENCDSLTKIVGLEGLASIKQLKLRGNNASFVNYTLTKSLFQTYSEFGHEIHITTIDKREFGHEIHLFPEWIINASCVQGSTLVLDFPPNVLQEPIFLGIVLCFESNEYPVTCIIENTARNIILWTGKFDPTYGGSMMVILPSSMVPLTAEGHTIDLIGEYGRERIHAVHLLYKE